MSEKADFIFSQARSRPGRAVINPHVGEEVPQRHLHGGRDFGEGIERRDGVAILYAREVAAQQSGALFNVTLRHIFAQPETTNGLAYVHGISNSILEQPGECVNSNQSSSFWQAQFFAPETALGRRARAYTEPIHVAYFYENLVVVQFES